MPEYVHACQTGNDNTEKAAELWYLAKETWGRQGDVTFSRAPEAGLGVDGPLKLRTQPFAPIGNTGRTRLRRIYVMFGWQFGGARVRVTPIVDFVQRLPATTVVLAAPPTSAYLRQEVEIPAARMATWVEVEIEVLERSGRVDVMGVYSADHPLAEAVATVAEPT
ncbi:MAG: hypothetical protein OER21_10745 [Gemmatimonadota bacterium]|nr:hypothetical protein [Gemmatimonadota bacterium]